MAPHLTSSERRASASSATQDAPHSLSSSENSVQKKSEPLIIKRPTSRIPPLRLEPRAIEREDFPFEAISEAAQLESWRKEIYRPIYHIHKWWAQRLGSIFRAAIIAAAAPAGTNIEASLHRPVQLEDYVVYDPFVGSGTTVGEAHKLGARAVGIDINPVAIRTVRTALGHWDEEALEDAFEAVRAHVEAPLRALHATRDAEDSPAEALYWFWVKQLPCEACGENVDLFSARIFARHAYPQKNPLAHAVCPQCSHVFGVRYDAHSAQCTACATTFELHKGPVSRSYAVCPSCNHRFSLVEAARRLGRPFDHRLYAKLILNHDGQKAYLAPDFEDIASYQRAQTDLEKEQLILPTLPIDAGHNTNQILAYNYCYWREIFNARQLLGLGRLAASIRALDPSPERTALGVLFSGMLEFNNLFATYKGEGTGAVRHMFSHHILKPERTPIEANIWGTSKSSGSFSTLYKRRLLKAAAYRNEPFEVKPQVGEPRKAEKVFGLSPPIGGPVYSHWPTSGLPPRGLMLAARDAKTSRLPSESVDLVVTDPPYFDNVHYSELADFFAAWTEAWSGEPARSTRAPGEVQDVDLTRFYQKLRDVFSECARVLRDDGRLVMSFHHRKDESWSALGGALVSAGFSIVEAHPVKAELSRASPKAQARAPIDIDILLVARKAAFDDRTPVSSARALFLASDRAARRALRYQKRIKALSLHDARALLLSQYLVCLCPERDETAIERAIKYAGPHLEPLIRTLHRDLIEPPLSSDRGPSEQLSLF